MDPGGWRRDAPWDRLARPIDKLNEMQESGGCFDVSFVKLVKGLGTRSH